MKIAILGASTAKESIRLKEEAEKRNHSLGLISYCDLSFIFQPQAKILIGNSDLAKKYDVLIIRGLTKNTAAALIVAHYMHYHHKIVIDRKLANKQFFLGKQRTSYNFTINNLSKPDTWYFLGSKNIRANLKKVKYPAIIKDVLGKRSKKIYRIDNQKEAIAFFQKQKSNDFLIQNLIPTNTYIRIFIIAGIVIGAISRTKVRAIPKPGHEIKAGVKSKPLKINQKLKKLSLQAAKVVKNDICGVDILEYQGKYYVI